MKLIGILVFSAAAVFLYKEHIASLSARMKQYEMLKSLFSHLERSVADGKRTQSEALRSFDFSAYTQADLKEIFLSPTRESLGQALSDTEVAELDIISDFLSSPSAASVKEEVERIKKAAAHIERKLSEIKSEYPAKARVSFVVLVTAIIYVFFLMI